MNTALKYLKQVELILIVALTIAMVAVAFSQVIFRVALHNPLAWSEEAARYLFVWIVFIGGAWAVSGDAHFKMDFLLTAVRSGGKKVLVCFSSICMIVFAVIMFVYGFRLVLSVASQKSPALQISMAIPYSALPLSGILIIIHSVELAVKSFLKKGQEEA